MLDLEPLVEKFNLLLFYFSSFQNLCFLSRKIFFEFLLFDYYAEEFDN